jgi:hypothetical protein
MLSPVRPFVFAMVPSSGRVVVSLPVGTWVKQGACVLSPFESFACVDPLNGANVTIDDVAMVSALNASVIVPGKIDRYQVMQIWWCFQRGYQHLWEDLSGLMTPPG